MSSEAEQYGRELEQQRRGFEEITAEIQAFQDLISVNEQNIAEFQRQLDEKQEKLRIGQTAYHRESSRLESLKNITERYDGYGNSIRRVMSCKDREKGLIGVVADIIKVEKEYEIAVETALGGSIQNIVTDDEETAKRMIAYLKQNKYGRATFLPLTSMQGGAELWQMDALKETGVIGLAHTLVHVEERFLGLAKQLLGRTIVVENIDCGIRIARKYKQSLRLVTLEGELINPGGSMTGGAFKNSSNLLSRRREIEEFEKTVKLLKRDMEEMEHSISAIKAQRAECYAGIDEIQQKITEASVRQNTARMNVEQVQRQQTESRQRCESYAKEQEELEITLREIRENGESIQVELEASKELEAALNQKIEELQKQLEIHREAEAAQLKQSEEVHLSLAGLQQQDLFIKENIAWRLFRRRTECLTPSLPAFCPDRFPFQDDACISAGRRL